MKVAIVTKFPRTVGSHISLVVIFVATSFVATLFDPAFGQTYSDRRMLEMSYDSKYYKVTARLAGDILKRRPDDEYALYYRGRSLARLGRNGEARLALVKCQRLSRGTELGLLADQAVTELLPYDVELDKAKVEPNLSSVNTQERQRLLAEQEKELDAAQKRFDRKIEQYQKDFSPPQLNRLTQAEFDQLSREHAAIVERYQKRADALLRRNTIPAVPELPSLPNASKTVHKYVRSYDPSRAATIPNENPLHAKALKLGSISKKGAAVKAASKKKPDGK
ncbi:MAG: hypothetical protein WC028_16775 [Candidatus Obscuribacterales bacterium]